MSSSKSSSSKSNDNTFREAIDLAIDSMTTIDLRPILSDTQKKKLINAIGEKNDPGGSTHNIKQYLSNLRLDDDSRNNIKMLLDFLPMVIYLPFGCLHDFGDKKVAKICLVAGMTHFLTTRPNGTNFELLINILRQELTRRDRETLGLEINSGGIAVRDAAGNGEGTFATKDTKALHNVWWKLLELIIAKIKDQLPEGVQWNFVPMKKSFSFTGDKTDHARQTLADEIKAWVNSFGEGVNIADKIVAVLDVTDKIALMVSGNKVLHTNPLSEPTLGDIDAFSSNVPDATSFPIPAADFQQAMLRGSVGLSDHPSVKIYFQIITKAEAEAMIPTARSIQGQTTIVYEDQQILQYIRNEQGTIEPLALIPFSISVNNVYLSCKEFDHPVANRGIGFTVEACKVIWLKTLSSIDKAVLLEACKGKGDETTSDLCEKAIELQKNLPPEEQNFFWSVGGDELQLDYQVSLGLPGFIRSGDGYSRTVVVWASTLGGDIAPIMIQLFLNKLEDLVKCARIWLQHDSNGNDNMTNMLNDFNKNRGNIIDELQNLINLNAFLNFLVTINVSADNCRKLLNAAITFVTSTQETDEASDTFINSIQSLANGIEFGYSELLDELDAGIRPDNEEGNYVAYTVESSCSQSASTLRKVHEIKITKQSPGEELPEIISIANIMHRCAKSLTHNSTKTDLISAELSVVNAVDEWLTQKDDGKLAAQVTMIMGSTEAGNCFLGEIKVIHTNILRRILKNTRSGIKAAKLLLNPTESNKKLAEKAKSAGLQEEERRIEKGELLWPYLAVNEVRVVVPTMEQMKGEIEENLHILQNYGVDFPNMMPMWRTIMGIMQIIETQALKNQEPLRQLKTQLFFYMKELEEIKRENKGHLDQLRSTNNISNLSEQIGRNNIQEAIKIVLKNCELVRGLSLRRSSNIRKVGLEKDEMVDYTDGNRFCIGDDVLQSIAKTETLPELCRETKFNVIWEALGTNRLDIAAAAGESFMRILYYFLKDNLEGDGDGADMNKLIYSIFYYCMGVDSEQKKAVFKRVKWKVALESIIALDGMGAQSQEIRGRRRVRDATKSETRKSTASDAKKEQGSRGSRSRSPSRGGIDDERGKIKDKIIQLVSTGGELKMNFETTADQTRSKLAELEHRLNARAGGGKKMKTIKKQKKKKKTERKRKRRKKKTIKRRRRRGRKTRRK